ncbi:hypothetical protein ABZ807_08085 [Micromonospora sp. NPDC047548]|uniref:hypothetical protein n=1 Tax=Micromonospora sp. NPDC047548 TaxID=3155624 RepID=UPI0033C80C41
MTTDEEDFAGLLRHLDDGPDRPSRVDLSTAIREARRRRRNRRTLTASVAGVAAVAAVAVVPLAVRADRPAEQGPPMAAGTSASASLPPPSSGPTTCTAELLPIPGGAHKSQVTGGDPTGRYLLGRSYPSSSFSYPVIIWDGDQAREVRLPGSSQQLVDVSPSGVAVGEAYVGDRPQPYVVRAGKATRLPGVAAGEATAISDDGRIVGARQDGDRRLPVLWSDPEKPAVDLPLPGPKWQGIAIGVDSDGTVVGKIQNGPHEALRAVVWRSGGKPELLPLPSVTGGTATDFAPKSFQGGWITGRAYRREGDGPVHAVRYHLARGEYVPLPAELNPSAGNGRGWMVGLVDHTWRPSRSAPGPAIGTGLLTDDGLVRLPDLDGRTGRYGADAVSISDDGQVIGGALDTKPGRQTIDMRAVRWRCR